jgi:YVTN family beta-propeller protein
MEFRILGPLEVIEQGKTLPLGGGQQLSLFALLLLHANEVVSTDRLVDELWAERPPATAEKIVRNYVSLLRKLLGDRLVTRPPGYLLRVEPGELDSERFETLVREAREEEPGVAAASLRKALALWSGPPLAQLAYEPFAQEAIGRLEELRLGAVEDRIDADLQLGRDRDVVAELEKLVREHPLRERPRNLLMLALYRSGRQAEALEVYQDARRTLVDELGLEPSPDLQELQQRILSHDPGLAGPPRRGLVAARRRRGGLMIAAGGAVLVAAGIAAGVVELTGNGVTGLPRLAANSVGVINPSTNRIVAGIPLGAAPTAITYGDGAVWTANTADSTVTRIDPRTRRVVKTIAVPGQPSGLAIAGSNLWVLLLRPSGYAVNSTNNGDVGLTQIDTSANDVFASFPLSTPTNTFDDRIAAGNGALWAADFGVISRINPASGNVTKKIATSQFGTSAITVGAGSVWTVGPNSVYRIDPATNTILTQIPITGATGPNGPSQTPTPTPTAVAFGDGALWVANRLVPPEPLGLQRVRPALPGTVSRIDPRTNAVVATIPVGRYSVALAVDAGAVWVANRDSNTLSKIDPGTNTVATIKLGARPQGVTTGGGAVWVTVS